MVVLNRIWTGTGDDGSSALISGERRPKFDLRIDAYGSVDETNAVVGLARIHTSGMVDLDAALARIQNDLFDLGADLANPETAEQKVEPLRIVDTQVTRLEGEIDALTHRLPPLRSFVLPGGTVAAAHLHHARVVARRAERLMFALAQREPIGRPALRYINRLSDFLFVAARSANDMGARDVLWVPGAGR